MITIRSTRCRGHRQLVLHRRQRALFRTLWPRRIALRVARGLDPHYNRNFIAFDRRQGETNYRGVAQSMTPR